MLAGGVGTLRDQHRLHQAGQRWVGFLFIRFFLHWRDNGLSQSLLRLGGSDRGHIRIRLLKRLAINGADGGLFLGSTQLALNKIFEEEGVQLAICGLVAGLGMSDEDRNAHHYLVFELSQGLLLLGQRH